VTSANVAHLPVGVPGKSSPTVARRLRTGDVMRSPTNVVAPDTAVTAVATLLAATGCSGVPVVSGAGQVVGLVTEADLVRHQLRSAFGSAVASAPSVVGDVMTTEPLLAPSRYDLGALVGLMHAAGTSVVPIVDGRRLVGMVDMRDLVRIVGASNTRIPASRQASG
jgi:CBS domain-containing protein